MVWNSCGIQCPRHWLRKLLGIFPKKMVWMLLWWILVLWWALLFRQGLMQACSCLCDFFKVLYLDNLLLKLKSCIKIILQQVWIIWSNNIYYISCEYFLHISFFLVSRLTFFMYLWTSKDFLVIKESWSYLNQATCIWDFFRRWLRIVILSLFCWRLHWNIWRLFYGISPLQRCSIGTYFGVWEQGSNWQTCVCWGYHSLRWLCGKGCWTLSRI